MTPTHDERVRTMTVTDEGTQITTTAGEPVIVVRRFLAAPPELVFRAWSEPALLRRWWGPRRLEVTECELDSHLGGAWRIVHRAPTARNSVSTAGSSSSTLLAGVSTPGCTRVRRTTRRSRRLELSPVEGGTMLAMTTRHASVAARDQHVAAGMETGIVESFERLDEMVGAQP